MPILRASGRTSGRRATQAATTKRSGCGQAAISASESSRLEWLATTMQGPSTGARPVTVTGNPTRRNTARHAGPEKRRPSTSRDSQQQPSIVQQAAP